MSAIEDIDAAADREDRLQQQRAAREEARRGPAFEIVGDLPESTRGSTATVHPARQELADAARANPGRWVRYTPGNRETIKKVAYTVQASCRKHVRPFEDPGFEGAVRGGDFYLRWTDGGDAA